MREHEGDLPYLWQNVFYFLHVIKVKKGDIFETNDHLRTISNKFLDLSLGAYEGQYLPELLKKNP